MEFRKQTQQTKPVDQHGKHLWSSGHDVSLTRWRSPLQPWRGVHAVQLAFERVRRPLSWHRCAPFLITSSSQGSKGAYVFIWYEICGLSERSLWTTTVLFVTSTLSHSLCDGKGDERSESNGYNHQTVSVFGWREMNLNGLFLMNLNEQRWTGTTAPGGMAPL